MNNNSVIINSYLQNEMSAAEKKAFEIQLANDKELQHELYIQRQVTVAAFNAGLKTEFADAMKKTRSLKRAITISIALVSGIAAILIIYFGVSPLLKKTTVEDLGKLAKIENILPQPFVNPPLPKLDIPFSEYFFDAEKGDTIFYPSGSIIIFPASALVDEAGNPVKGKVRIIYREFVDALDFFLSGIPMGYDSAGVKYNFESSGMCEINAFKNNKAVFVNKNAMPVINLTSKNKSPLHNLYYLDTASKTWKFRGKDLITEVQGYSKYKTIPGSQSDFNETLIPVKPVKPAKASDDHSSFSIEIDPGSFEELFAYDNLKFEVIDESTYKRSDAEEHWDNVKLERNGSEGIYTVTFTNSGRNVSYKVRPVLEGADYDAALNIFREKNIAYEQALQNRNIKEKYESDSISSGNKILQEKMNEENEWNVKMNALIIERNKKLRELKKQQMNAMEKAVAAQQIKEKDLFLKMSKAQAKLQADQFLSTNIMRTFNINNFGVWNCDNPMLNNTMPLYSKFIDSAKNIIPFPNITVVYRRFNGIAQFQPGNIRVMPGEENMVWAVLDSAFYYFTYDDFKTAQIGRNTKQFTFNMRKADKEISSYNDIRNLVGKL